MENNTETFIRKRKTNSNYNRQAIHRVG